MLVWKPIVSVLLGMCWALWSGGAWAAVESSKALDVAVVIDCSVQVASSAEARAFYAGVAGQYANRSYPFMDWFLTVSPVRLAVVTFPPAQPLMLFINESTSVLSRIGALACMNQPPPDFADAIVYTQRLFATFSATNRKILALFPNAMPSNVAKLHTVVAALRRAGVEFHANVDVQNTPAIRWLIASLRPDNWMYMD